MFILASSAALVSVAVSTAHSMTFDSKTATVFGCPRTELLIVLHDPHLPRTVRGGPHREAVARLVRRPALPPGPWALRPGAARHAIE